jgi:hypothetical protein
MSCIYGENRDIFFPKLSEELHLITFAEIALKYLEKIGYEPHLCNSEDEARELINTLPQQGKWPCLFSDSDTTGEKDFEEFFTHNEKLDLDRYPHLGVVKNDPVFDQESLEHFLSKINELKSSKGWDKEDLLCLFNKIIPSFNHKEVGRYLDGKM